MSPRYPALNEAQLAVLQWVSSGCPADSDRDWSHRISARTLHDRGLLIVRGRGPTWSATITDAGAYYLENGAYPEKVLPPQTHEPATTGEASPTAKGEASPSGAIRPRRSSAANARCSPETHNAPTNRQPIGEQSELDERNPGSTSSSRQLLKLSEVADRLQISQASLREASKSGQIPAYKIGRHWRYDPAELETWLMSTRNQAKIPSPRPSHFFTNQRPSLRHLEPKESELSSAWSAEQVAEALRVPVERVKQWIRQGLLPGRQVGSRWMTTEAIATEAVQIVKGYGTFEQLEPGRNRTRAATEALEQEMLNRRGIHLTVGSWRYHSSGSKSITWVPAGTRRGKDPLQH